MPDTFDKCKNSTYEEALKAGCDAIFENFGKKPFIWIKSELMSYILENAQIEVKPCELFAYRIYHFDIMQHYLGKTLVPFAKNAGNAEVDDAPELIACVGIETNTDFGHIAPDWSFLIREGICGVIKRLERYREERINAGESTDFYDCNIAVFNSLCCFILRLAEKAEALGTEKMRFTASNLRGIASHAPETLAEAIQLTLIIYTVQTYIEKANVRSLGGLDRLYVDLYRRDIESGRFTNAQLREMLRSFFVTISELKVVANTPFYICGRYPDGTDATNELTSVILEEYRAANVYDPKIHVMYHRDIPARVTDFILDMIREGKNSFVFVNIDTAEKSLRKVGISTEDAKKIIVYGCYETASEGEEIPSTCAGMVNMPKIFELFLSGGRDKAHSVVLKHRPQCNYGTFEEFYSSFKSFLGYAAKVCMDAISAYEKRYPQMFCANILSSTFKSSVVKGVDVFSGGAKYNNTSIVCACLASVADSVAAVKKLVYDDKTVTLDELREILDKNWEGNEKLRKYCISSCPKFANNDDAADSIAADICRYLSGVINGYSNSRGGVFRFGMFSIDWRLGYGRNTGALPDGRYAGEPLSKNFNAVVGCDRNGTTSFLNSVLKIDSESIPDGCVADVLLHSSAVHGAEGLCAMKGLLSSFCAGGGFAVQFNVLSSELLKDARKNPDKYRNLQIRVCGWNANFVSLSDKEQEEFIIQSEAL